MICWVRSASRAASSVGSESASSLRVGVQGLRAAQHRRQRLHRYPHHVHVGLLRGQRRAGRLRMKAQHHRARIPRAEPLAHDGRVQPPRRAVLRDLLKKIIMRVKEKRKTRGEGVDFQARLDGRLDVGDGVGQA